MKSNPSKTQIFQSGKNIFFAPESWSGSTSFTDSHILGFRIDFIEECLFNSISSESFVCSFNIFWQNIIELKIKAHFGEEIIDLSLADAIVFGESPGIEIINFQVIGGRCDDIDGTILTDIESFIDKGVFGDLVDQSWGGCNVDSFQTLAEHGVTVINEIGVAFLESIAFEFV